MKTNRRELLAAVSLAPLSASAVATSRPPHVDRAFLVELTVAIAKTIEDHRRFAAYDHDYREEKRRYEEVARRAVAGDLEALRAMPAASERLFEAARRGHDRVLESPALPFRP